MKQISVPNGRKLSELSELFRKVTREKQITLCILFGNGRLSRSSYENFQLYHLPQKVSVQCKDNRYGYGGVVVIGDETFPMTSSCIPDTTGYSQYIARVGNQFGAGVINAENWNDARASCNDNASRCSHGPSFKVEKN
ncbi:uncharacterized protein LOC143715664 [Siphateles boraxobius]|uniref:uncharacterized protein LOC143715664 n=1 Tax=Siphateles boraxobius TaxID=180520 RepID=UPI00406386BE